MFNFLQSLNVSNYEKLVAKFEATNLRNVPLHIYWKDKKGTYLGNNDKQALDAGFEQSSDLYGKTDYDLAWANEASVIRNNDQLVVLKGKSGIFIEHATLADASKIKCFSYKSPLHAVKTKKIVGILGVSFLIKDVEMLSSSIDLDGLTKRQKQCVYWLARGCSMKKIGQQLGISARTVEGHLEVIKHKLHCYTRQELIEKITSRTIF